MKTFQEVIKTLRNDWLCTPFGARTKWYPQLKINSESLMEHTTQHPVMEAGALSSEMKLAKWLELVQRSPCLLVDSLRAEVIACYYEGVREAADCGIWHGSCGDRDRLVSVEASPPVWWFPASNNGWPDLRPKNAYSHEFYFCFLCSCCSRSCNSVAHTPVEIGCMCAPNVPMSWDSTPPGVETIVASDLTASFS